MKIIRLLFILLISTTLFAQNYYQKYSANLKDHLSEYSDQGNILVWVFFKDKGSSLNKYFEKPSSVVSEASLKRRAKVLKPDKLINFADLPVNKKYINELENTGVNVKHVSRWFNGISSYIKLEDLPKIASYNFVKNIDLVGLFKKPTPPELDKNINPNEFAFRKQKIVHNLDYGPSFEQLEQIKVPEVHDLGYDGSGVIICVMDAGVSNLSHEVFDYINILDTYDFVNKDSNISNQADSGEGSHGTYTLGLIGGYKPGSLVGPAYGATYLLAKTENTDSESPIEEDNWIAAMEWADNLGAQVTSTSLGYRDGFQFGFRDYTAADMDGETARITIGAEMAVRRGIVVVNSVGNEAQTLAGEQNTLVAPADGDSVIAVGAVDVKGNRAYFSSNGPTADDRIKPDVMALGFNDYIPNSVQGATTGYLYGNGTSFACPLVAGVAALILQANPDWTPMQVRDALRKTASKSNNPDSFYGWGLINAQAAVNYNPNSSDSLSSGNTKNSIPKNFELEQNYPNPFNPSTNITYKVKEDGYVTLKIYNLLGNLVATLVDEYEPASVYTINFDAKSGDNPLPSGVYFYRLQVGGFVATKKMVIMK